MVKDAVNISKKRLLHYHKREGPSGGSPLTERSHLSPQRHLHVVHNSIVILSRFLDCHMGSANDKGSCMSPGRLW